MREPGLADIFRRDIDRIETPSEAVWLPVRPRRRRVSPLLAAACVVLALVIGATAGVALRRAEPVASTDPSMAQLAPSGEVCLAAQRRVLGMSGIVRHADRIAAKRMTAADFTNGGGTSWPAHDPRTGTVTWPTTMVCVVAIAGDIQPQLARGESATWAIFVSFAETDDPVALIAGSGATWPPYFDALPNRFPTPYPGTIVEVIGQQEIRVKLESAVLSQEFGNPVSLRADQRTKVLPAGTTISSTGARVGDRVRVSFERETWIAALGSYALSTFELERAGTAPPVVVERAVSLAVIDLGPAPDRPGVRQPVRPGTLALGPTSFAFDDERRLYLWDQAGLRILVYELGATATVPRLIRSVAVSNVPWEATGLVVYGDVLYLRTQQDDGTPVAEFQIDGTTGRVTRTADLFRGESSLYPRLRPTRTVFAEKGAIHVLGPDARGFRYEAHTILSGCHAEGCREYRRVRESDGAIVAVTPRPAASERDDYVTTAGGVYQLRWDQDPAPTRIEIVQLLAPITGP